MRSLSTAIAALAATAIAAASLGGCAMSPRLDRQFGSSVRFAQSQQTLNPQAKNNRDPVGGMDAAAARSAYDNYQRSFAAPEAQSTGFSLGAGAGSR